MAERKMAVSESAQLLIDVAEDVNEAAVRSYEKTLKTLDRATAIALICRMQDQVEPVMFSVMWAAAVVRISELEARQGA